MQFIRKLLKDFLRGEIGSGIVLFDALHAILAITVLIVMLFT